MSTDIAKSMFRKMATFGEVFAEERVHDQSIVLSIGTGFSRCLRE